MVCSRAFWRFPQLEQIPFVPQSKFHLEILGSNRPNKHRVGKQKPLFVLLPSDQNTCENPRATNRALNFSIESSSFFFTSKNHRLSICLRPSGNSVKIVVLFFKSVRKFFFNCPSPLLFSGEDFD